MNGVLLLAFLWVLKAFLEVMLVILDHLLLLFFNLSTLLVGVVFNSNWYNR